MKRSALVIAAAFALAGCSSANPTVTAIPSPTVTAEATSPSATPASTLRPGPSTDDMPAIRAAVSNAGLTMDDDATITAAHRFCVNGIMAGKDRSELLTVVQQQFGDPSALVLSEDESQGILSSVTGTFCHA